MLKRCIDDHRLQHYEAIFSVLAYRATCTCQSFPKFVPMRERFADRHCTLGEARMMEASAAVVASRRIILHLLLRYRRVMAYVASRRIILLLLCFVGRVMVYIASRRIILLLRSRRITLLLRLWSLRWTMVISQRVSCLFLCRSCASVLLLHLPLWNDFFF